VERLRKLWSVSGNCGASPENREVSPETVECFRKLWSRPEDRETLASNAETLKSETNGSLVWFCLVMVLRVFTEGNEDRTLPLTAANPSGVAARSGERDATPLGLTCNRAATQGSSFLATLGWRAQSLWDCRTASCWGRNYRKTLG
jgi:hypothetical protein